MPELLSKVDQGLRLQIEYQDIMNNVDRTRRHYDRQTVASSRCSDRQAMRERSMGPSAPLKKYHNAVKRYLLTTFASGAERLLDVGCGRGGDLRKWVDVGVAYVKALDISIEELREAKRRYLGMNRGFLRCDFVCTDDFGLKDWRDAYTMYDSVTCMFALHYFWETKAMAHQFFKNVSENLKLGGYFFGILPNRALILDLVRDNPQFGDHMLQVKKCWEGDPQPFGSAYVCSIGDTIVSSNAHTVGSVEYLVCPLVMIEVARKHGLEPVVEYGDQKAFFQPSSTDSFLKCFAPDFPGSCHPSLTTASKLFAAFAFRKVRLD